MNHLETLPPAGQLVIAALLVFGATITLLGSVGLVRFRTFYERLHAPTLATSAGTAAIALASLLTFSLMRGRPVLHELVVVFFVTLTTPIGLVLLARAAHRRHPSVRKDDAPEKPL